MTDYKIVIHLRDSDDPIGIAMPGLSADNAEADRQDLMYEIEEARLAEVPIIVVQTRSGFPSDPLPLDPHAVTEVDLADG